MLVHHNLLSCLSLNLNNILAKYGTLNSCSAFLTTINVKTFNFASTCNVELFLSCHFFFFFFFSKNFGNGEIVCNLYISNYICIYSETLPLGSAVLCMHVRCGTLFLINAFCYNVSYSYYKLRIEIRISVSHRIMYKFAF